MDAYYTCLDGDYLFLGVNYTRFDASYRLMDAYYTYLDAEYLCLDVNYTRLDAK